MGQEQNYLTGVWGVGCAAWEEGREVGMEIRESDRKELTQIYYMCIRLPKRGREEGREEGRNGMREGRREGERRKEREEMEGGKESRGEMEEREGRKKLEDKEGERSLTE